jgi:UDP-3-O-[3-hydroxymyristoyl] glucosamine N-acyltransferase
MGGQVGVPPHVKIGSKAQIGAQAGILSDIPEGAIVIGTPARPKRDFFREVAILKKLARR